MMGKINTLFELFNEYEIIEIPIIQRDYAQGRRDEHATRVRDNLLEDMKNAILGNIKQLNINFVYGKSEGKKFIPVDGQQRLTTLFLLHVYAFSNDESRTNFLSKFTYKTRETSRKFLEKLIENRKSVFSSDLAPSNEINESEWFVPNWKYDPTVLSVLTMLDKIKEKFSRVDILEKRLLDSLEKPIIFEFLDIEGLGMEDSLYIKLNARGRPLTPFESFKARLIAQLEKLVVNFPINYIIEFENNLDVKWTDLFWSYNKENFDYNYLTFFGVLIMNKEIYLDDTNDWSNDLEYEQLDKEIFDTILYTLNYLCGNSGECSIVYKLIFNALGKERTYQDRVLFHAVTSYLYSTKGIDNGSLTQWLRIIKNLVLNSRIDEKDLYRRAINGINSFIDNRDDLLGYFFENGSVSGVFSGPQIEEERNKARIILKNEDFAKEIYKAEEHPYFCGQIRSALYYSSKNNAEPDINLFTQYWKKISNLFNDKGSKNADLLRQALLTFGDYTLEVANNKYKTLCVDRQSEEASSFKRLFSDHGKIVKQLLDTLNFDGDFEKQLKKIVENSSISPSDWRYCFIKLDFLFEYMSDSYKRLRNASDELIMISNMSSTGYNYGVFLTTLHELLKQKGLMSDFKGEYGTERDRYLSFNTFNVRFKKGVFIFQDKKDNIVFETTTDDPLTKAMNYINLQGFLEVF